MAKRILIVEDDLDNLRITETVLRLAGHEVSSAADGIEALDRLASFKPDLILIDLQLPRLDGWETTRRIKARPGLQSTPIIALTGFALKGDETAARSAGCDDYLAKPCRPAVLREKVDKWLGTDS